MNGILNILKPPGMTSSDVVVFVRKTLKEKKVGHTGTLDPGASGVLPICIGKATRLFNYIVEKDKEYIAELTLGSKTDTQDSYGKVIETSHNFLISKTELNEVLENFIGNIQQKPPMFSAVKIHGKKLYDLAREGKTIDRPLRNVIIKQLDIIDQIQENQFLLKVKCTKGTYVRTLCNDIGEALGCGGHMSFLLRTSSGPFTIANSITLDEISQMAYKDSINDTLLPLDYPLREIPAIYVRSLFHRKVMNGNPIELEWLEQNSDKIQPNEYMRVYSNGIFCGIGYYKEDLDHHYIAIKSLLI